MKSYKQVLNCTIPHLFILRSQSMRYVSRTLSVTFISYDELCTAVLRSQVILTFDLLILKCHRGAHLLYTSGIMPVPNLNFLWYFVLDS